MFAVKSSFLKISTKFFLHSTQLDEAHAAHLDRLTSPKRFRRYARMKFWVKTKNLNLALNKIFCYVQVEKGQVILPYWEEKKTLFLRCGHSLGVKNAF